MKDQSNFLLDETMEKKKKKRSFQINTWPSPENNEKNITDGSENGDERWGKYRGGRRKGLTEAITRNSALSR